MAGSLFRGAVEFVGGDVEIRGKLIESARCAQARHAVLAGRRAATALGAHPGELCRRT